MPIFKSINSSSPSKQTYDGGKLTPTPCQQLSGQNTLVEIGSNKLTEPSDTLNAHYFLNNSFCKLFYTWFYSHIFICFFFNLVWGGIRHYSIEDSVFYNVLRNQRVFSYNIYNLLRIARKQCSKKRLQIRISVKLCNTLHKKLQLYDIWFGL